MEKIIDVSKFFILGSVTRCHPILSKTICSAYIYVTATLVFRKYLQHSIIGLTVEDNPYIHSVLAILKCIN